MTMSPSPFGHWAVAGKNYYNKLKAVIDAVPQGWWPHFYFHEHVFSKHNWKQDPSQSLDQLYNQRAQQLRSKYEHITVEFSGGADSWYVLYSFLRQGLHVDVVFHKYVDMLDLGKQNLSAANQHAEAKYQAWPWFKKFQELDPNMKWHLVYVKDMIIDYWTGHRADPFDNNIFHVGIVPKLAHISVDQYSFIPGNKSSAVVYGLDKPNLFFKDNKFYLYFSDATIMHRTVLERWQAGIPMTDVLFYWDPDCCELLTKQAHVVMNWFRRNPSFLPLISDQTRRDSDLYFDIVNQLIYPEYQKTWQSEKAKGKYKMTHEKWFHHTGDNTKHVKNWQASMQSLSDTVQSTLIGTEFESFVEIEDGFFILPNGWSKMYEIGSL